MFDLFYYFFLPVHRDEMLKAYKEDKIQEQIALDVQNALSSLKVIPNKCTIQPYHKVPLKIQFKPVGIMTKLNVQVYVYIDIFPPLHRNL